MRWRGGNNSVVECDLAKVEVAGSNPVSRSNFDSGASRRAVVLYGRRRTRQARSVTRGPYARSTPRALQDGAPSMLPAMNWLSAALIALSLAAQAPVERPRLLGIAHLAVFVSNPEAARAFYQDLLGFEESFAVPKTAGSPARSFVKINDRQWVELIDAQTVGEGQLDHVAFYTSDVASMRSYLASRGVSVPDEIGRGPTGDRSFTVVDPDGHRIEFVEYLQDSRTGKDVGAHLPARRIAERAAARRHPGRRAGAVVILLCGYPRIRRNLAGERGEFRDPELGQHAGARRNRLPGVHALRREARLGSPRHRASSLPARA